MMGGGVVAGILVVVLVVGIAAGVKYLRSDPRQHPPKA